jgi:hypothetical protein
VTALSLALRHRRPEGNDNPATAQTGEIDQSEVNTWLIFPTSKEIKTFRVDNPDDRGQLDELNRLLKSGCEIVATGFGQYASPVKEEGRMWILPSTHASLHAGE